MNSDPLLSEQFRIVAKAYVDADSAASLLEETKSAVLARMMLSLGDMPVSRARSRWQASSSSGGWYVRSRVRMSASQRAKAPERSTRASLASPFFSSNSPADSHVQALDGAAPSVCLDFWPLTETVNWPGEYSLSQFLVRAHTR